MASIHTHMYSFILTKTTLVIPWAKSSRGPFWENLKSNNQRFLSLVMHLNLPISLAIIIFSMLKINITLTYMDVYEPSPKDLKSRNVPKLEIILPIIIFPILKILKIFHETCPNGSN